MRSFLEDAGNDCQPAADILVTTSGSPIEEVVDDKSDEEFWTTLPAVISRERHILSLPTKPDRSYPGKAVRSRLVALGTSDKAP